MKKYILTAALSCVVGVTGAYADQHEAPATQKAPVAQDAPATQAAPKQAESTELGVLSCEVEGGIGLILGSSKGVSCEFTHSDGSVERYTGTMGKLGLDIGITDKSFMKWVVVTPVGNEVGAHALAGDYVGVSAGGSIGIGLGANALVGGSGKKIGLQPFSAESTKGLNVAIGATKLSLQPAE